MQNGRLLAALLAAFLHFGQAVAQEEDGAIAGAVLPVAAEEIGVINLEMLLQQSQFWGRVLSERGEALRQLGAESAFYDQKFADEEAHLAEIRPVTPPKEFQAMADEFNVRVDAQRAIQDKKEERISTWVEDQRVLFFRAVVRLAGEYAWTRGMKMIMPSAALVWYQGSVDITGAILNEANERVGGGTGLVGYRTAIEFAGIELPEAE